MQQLSTDELGQLLFSSEESTREEALRCLAARREERATWHLGCALEDATPGGFFYGLVSALGASEDPQALAALTRAYRRVRQDLPRLAILRAVGALAGPDSEAFLLSASQAQSSWALKIPALEILLSRRQTNITHLLLDAFAESPLPEKLGALLQKAYIEQPAWEISQAFTLRLMLGDPLPEEHLRAAIKVLAVLGDASAIPLLESWSAAIPALRRATSQAIRRLKIR